MKRDEKSISTIYMKIIYFTIAYNTAPTVIPCMAAHINSGYDVFKILDIKASLHLEISIRSLSGYAIGQQHIKLLSSYLVLTVVIRPVKCRLSDSAIAVPNDRHGVVSGMSGFRSGRR